MNNNLWWHGPSWLQQPQDNWPKDIISSVPIEEISLLADGEHPKEEQRDFLMKIENYSTLTRLLRVTAWIFRAVRKWKQLLTMKRKIPTKEPISPLEAGEIVTARLYLEKSVQNHYFAEEIKDIQKKKKNRMCQQLGLVLDAEGFLRCLGRFQNLALSEGSRMPKLLHISQN